MLEAFIPLRGCIELEIGLDKHCCLERVNKALQKSGHVPDGEAPYKSDVWLIAMPSAAEKGREGLIAVGRLTCNCPTILRSHALRCNHNRERD